MVEACGGERFTGCRPRGRELRPELDPKESNLPGPTPSDLLLSARPYFLKAPKTPQMALQQGTESLKSELVGKGEGAFELTETGAGS